MPGVRESPPPFHLTCLFTSSFLSHIDSLSSPAPDAMDQVKKGFRSLFSKKKPAETTTTTSKPSKTSDNPPVAHPTKTEPAAIPQPAALSDPVRTGAPTSRDPTAPPAGMLSSCIDTRAYLEHGRPYYFRSCTSRCTKAVMQQPYPRATLRTLSQSVEIGCESPSILEGGASIMPDC